MSSPEERELAARSAPTAPKPRGFTSTRFFKVLLVLVLLVVSAGVWGWYSQTPNGSVEVQHLSLDYSNWASSLAPPIPTVHSGLIHPATGPNSSVFFFTTSTPQTSQYAMEPGDTMFGDSITVYGFTPLATNATHLTFTSYTAVVVAVKDPEDQRDDPRDSVHRQEQHDLPRRSPRTPPLARRPSRSPSPRRHPAR